VQATIGIFRTSSSARDACRAVRERVPAARLRLFAPDTTVGELSAALPTDDSEQPGMGSAVAGVVGGAVGAAAASLLLPPVGAIAIAGIAAGALLGAGSGMVAGSNLEEDLSEGLPRDELFVYEDALQKGRVVVAAFVETDDELEAARDVFGAEGAETVDAARDEWWVGLRDAEEEEYAGSGGDFGADEPLFRRGFEAALHGEPIDLAEEDVATWLVARYPDVHDSAAFRRGFARGREHLARVRNLGVTRPPIVDEATLL
jgi:hypothetical protein